MKRSQHLPSNLVLLGIILSAVRAYSGASPAPAVDLVLSEKAPPAVKFGAELIRRALEEKTGLKIRIAPKPSPADLHIFLGRRGDEILASIAGDRLKAPGLPESYAILLPSAETIVIEGSDATGAMYGAQDLAEQVSWANGNDFGSQIKPVHKSPFLTIRGVNMFLTTQDIDEPDGAFWSDAFWTGFLDMMARDRYNFLDIHGPCEATSVEFPNGFSYFVSLPDFPEVGVGSERAGKNLARFRQMVRRAADRGIKVGYMNYVAAPPIGPWKTGRYGKDERWAPPPQKFLTGPRLEEYTRQAVASFLRQVPELWMFGFRVGESGQPEGFYKKTYLAALKDAPASLNLYVRTWIADPQEVREIAESTPHRLFIEPKYNGEHLGSPYQAALGGRQYPPSGSYEDYTNYPRHYSILWQIRAHGTHRVFYWGLPEFARRTVRSCKFGDGAGFSMESMNAYCPEADYLHNNPKTDHRFYKWMFEREWLWHLIWGRTAYDPEVSDRVWLSEFERRFGPEAGPRVYSALVESSKIVPFIYSYHNVGLDHQDFAPEFETGDHAFGARQRLWQGERLVPYGGNNDDFLRVGVLDRTAMASPVTYVDDFLKHLPSGRMTPFEAADYLGSAADASERHIHEAARSSPGSTKEFDCIRMDVEAVASLGRYYRDRILSVTHLEFYRRTYHHPELVAAYRDLQRAVEDWDRLSEVTDEHFGHVPETIRMGVNKFQWRDEGRSLGVDLDQINNMETEFHQLRERSWEYRTTVIGHVPLFKVRPGEALKVTATYATEGPEDEQHVFLFYRNSRETAYTRVALRLEKRFERTWTGEIPGEKVVPGYLEYYFEADTGRWRQYGASLEHRPPYFVFVNENNSRPVISHNPPAAPVHDSAVAFSAEVQARAKISSVRLYYKRTPAYHEWVKIEMEGIGSDRYRARVPLTSEGILYYFEAIDEDGNAANYPDFLKRTPYFAINGARATAREGANEMKEEPCLLDRRHGRRGVGSYP